MKLHLPIAKASAVTPLMLKHGKGEDATLVPATSLTLKCQVLPELLDELREGTSDTFYEPASEKAPKAPRVLRNPEIEGPFGWKTEYESATLILDLKDLEDLDFDDEKLTLASVDVSGIEADPLGTGMVDFKCNAIVQGDDVEMRGKLNALLQHTVKATLTKLTQKPLAEPKKPKDDASTNQQQLPIEGSNTLQ